MQSPPAHLRHIIRATSLAALVFLSACGGGSSESSSTGSGSSGSVTLTGVASKGLIGNANVRVLGIKASDGTVDEANVLATGVTNADGSGSYSTTAFTVPAVYVVEVLAKVCADTTAGTGCSYHQDEATNTRQYLPTGFKMRAVLTSAPANGKVNVTPFSELAVAAAQNAPGGLTAGNAADAVSLVNQLVGVTDLNSVVPKPLSAASGPDELRLAAMLTAVSTMANTPGALTASACGTGVTIGTPAATKCVVEKLAANANLSSESGFVGTNAAVSTALNNALTVAVATNPEAKSLVTSTQAKLTDPTIVPVTPVVASGIDKVKAFFNDLTSTVRTLVDSGTRPGQGALLSQAHLFENAVTGLNFQLDATTDAVQTLGMATKLWADYEHGGTAVSADIAKDLAWRADTGLHCSLRKQGTGDGVYVQPGDDPSLVTSVDCYADATFDINWSAGSGSYPSATYAYKNGYQHFVVTKAGGGVFNYVATAPLDVGFVTFNYQAGTTSFEFDPSPTCPQSSTNGECKPFLGTIATTLDSAGRLKTFHVAGDLPDGWKTGTVVAHASAGGANLAKTTIDLTASLEGTYVSAALGSDLQSGNLAFSGGNVAFAANGTTEESRITFAPGTFVSGTSRSVTANAFQSGRFDLTLQTPTAKLTGVLTGNSTANHGGTGSFTGALYNLPSSSSVPFISATLTATVTRPAGFNPSLAISPTNSQSASVTFDGFVTAPAHPKLRIILGAAGLQTSPRFVWGTSTQDTASGNFMVYNADGTTKRDVSFTVTSPNRDGVTTTSLTDVANGIAMSLVDRQIKTNVLVGGTVVGELDSRASSLTFEGGEYFSLDFGTVLYSD